MPTYLYGCHTCKKINDIVKPIAQLDAREVCLKCESVMERFMAPTQLNTRTCQFEAHFNHAFGKVVTTKRELEECRRKLSIQTGRDIVEVGTDHLDSVKPIRHEYEWDQYVNPEMKEGGR